MAYTVTLVKATPNELQYLINTDGNPGALVLDNATMAADLVAGDLRQLNGLGVDTREDPNTQAIARRDMLGDDAGGNPANMANLGHAKVLITKRAGIDVNWQVDADVDGVSPRRHELNILATAGAGAADIYLSIKFCHSLTR